MRCMTRAECLLALKGMREAGAEAEKGGGRAEAARILIYKGAKMLAQELSYPPKAEDALALVKRNCEVLVRDALAFPDEEKARLVGFYLDSLACNFKGDVRRSVRALKGYGEAFGDYDAVLAFVRRTEAGADRKGV